MGGKKILTRAEVFAREEAARARPRCAYCSCLVRGDRRRLSLRHGGIGHQVLCHRCEREKTDRT